MTPLIAPTNITDNQIREVLLAIYNAIRELRGETNNKQERAVLVKDLPRQ